MTTKAELHRLLDELPDDINDAVARYLDELRDPLMRALHSAPIDDEPLTPEEEAAIEEGLADFRAGRFRPWEEVREELERG